ncbi:DUF6528 family protein [Actinacidiphila acidipaludis]|uniref:DUF6528 family protein n=1 Tax=Actinacidiphila acidipaludis TaxID=2873382 RepID=A0ABS7QDU2_9ACTN|nr:DUF6528 family protein [Streptomyces acidipaludis]MBY8879929.1 DUF6528 family protein [Streptomyces acidipaludis]
MAPLVQSGPRNIVKRVQDTYVSNTDPRDHSDGALLHIGTPDNGATRYRSFLQFDVSKLHGASIKSAKLRLYDAYTGSCAGWWMYVDPVASAWQQSTITWDNKPGVTPGYQAAANFGIGHPDCPDVPDKTDPDQSNGLYRIDVTSMVNAWAQGTMPNYGMQLSAGESDSKAYKDFCSMNPGASEYACSIAYYTPTLEVEFDSGSTALMSGDNYGVPYPGGYPSTSPALEFFDSSKPSVWPSSGPYQRWIPDDYHSVFDPALLGGTTFGGGTEFKVRPMGAYASTGGLSKQLLVIGDGNSGFVGVVPYPALSGYRWAINVGHAASLHGVELLPDGSVAVAEVGSNAVKVYTAAQGTPGNSPSAWATPSDTESLPDAHQVLWDDTTGTLWAVGADPLHPDTQSVLVQYDYSAGKLTRRASYQLPANGTKSPWVHDIAPVYGNPDRFWVSANAGVVQFSKSGQSPCYNISRWPTVSELGPDAAHWCTDYPYESQVNRYSMVKATGNDPATGRVLTTCQQRDPTVSDNCHPQLPGSDPWLAWTSPDLDFVDSSGRTSYSWDESHACHYRARWLVPSYT